MKLALVLVLAAAAADEGTDAARELFRAGSEAYRQGEYAVAIGAFEEVYKIAPRPPVVFSLAQSYRLQYFVDGDVPKLARGVALYREYLKLVDKGGRRDDAAQLLATLVPILERRQSEPAPALPAATEGRATGRMIVASRVEGAIARLDGGDPQPIPTTFEVMPGEHRVLVEAPEHQPKTLETVAIAGSVVALNVELEPIPGQLVVSAPDGATLNVDGRVISATAMSEPVDLPAGRHLVVVSARGREPLVEQLEITRGQSVALTADLPMTSQRIGSYVLFIGAGALLAAGGAAAALALDAESSAEALEMKRAGGTALTVAEAQRFGALVSERDDYVRLGTAAAITGAGAALTGMFLFLFDDPEPPRAPLLSPMTTDGGGLGAVGTLTW